MIILLILLLIIWNIVIIYLSSSVPSPCIITLRNTFDANKDIFDEYVLGQLLFYHAQHVHRSRIIFFSKNQNITGPESRYDIDVFSGNKIPLRQCFVDYDEHAIPFVGLNDSRFLGLSFNDNILQKSHTQHMVKQTVLCVNACFMVSKHIPTIFLTEWGHVNDKDGGIASARHNEGHHMRGDVGLYPDPLYGIEYQRTQLTDAFLYVLQRLNVIVKQKYVFYSARRPPNIIGGMFRVGDHGYHIMKAIESTDPNTWKISDGHTSDISSSLLTCPEESDNDKRSRGCVCYVSPSSEYRKRFVILPALGNVAGEYIPGSSLLRIDVKEKTIRTILNTIHHLNTLVETEYLWLPAFSAKKKNE